MQADANVTRKRPEIVGERVPYGKSFSSELHSADVRSPEPATRAG